MPQNLGNYSIPTSYISIQPKTYYNLTNNISGAAQFPGAVGVDGREEPHVTQTLG